MFPVRFYISYVVLSFFTLIITIVFLCVFCVCVLFFHNFYFIFLITIKIINDNKMNKTKQIPKHYKIKVTSPQTS